MITRSIKHSFSAVFVTLMAYGILRTTACMDPSVCLRNSDCSGGYVCLVQTCVPPPVETTDGDVTDEASSTTDAISTMNNDAATADESTSRDDDASASDDAGDPNADETGTGDMEM